jgi:PAS domain S-box-containing protein
MSHASGRWLWVKSRDVVYQRDSDGVPTQILGTAEDITLRKLAEEALRESEARLRAMIEQANVGIVQTSFDGGYLVVNPGFCAIVGYTEPELCRMTVRDVTHPDDCAAEEDLTRQLIAGEIPGYSFEKRFVRRDGGIIWGNMTAALVRRASGEPFCVLAIVEDISERKRAEEALRNSEERLRLTMESVTDYAIFTTDTEGRVETWNVGAERIFGYTEEEIVGQRGAIIFTPEDRAKGEPEKEMREAREAGRAADERWHVRKDDSRFYASGVLAPLRDEGGAVVGYAKIARDLTAQKRAEEALRRAHDELEARVKERTSELQEVNESLLTEVRERMAAEERARGLVRQIVTAQEEERKRVARDLHDQLGQQLTALQLKLETHRARLADDEDLRAQVEEIQTVARQLDNEVDFLAWELRPASLDDLGLPVALGNFIEEWSRHFGIPAEFHTTGFVSEADRLPPEIETNLYRIAQEALNNVYKHAGAGSVDVIFERRADQVVLIVEDDGKGFNLRTAVGPKDRGIGLINMRERASFVGGTMEIESKVGVGTTLFVRVPIQEVSHD